MEKRNWKYILSQTLSVFFSLALAIIFYFLILRLGQIAAFMKQIIGILQPFIYGGVMAFLLKTPCNHIERILERRRLPKKLQSHLRGLTVTIIMLLALLLLYLLLYLMIPQLAESIKTLFSSLQTGATMVADWALNLTSGSEVLHSYVEDAINGLSAMLSNFSRLAEMLQNVVGGFATTVGTVMTTLYNFIIGVIVCVYILLDRKNLARHGKALLYGLLPPQYGDAIMSELIFVDQTFVGFFNGKILDSAIIGLICYVFCQIMAFITGFPNALLVSIIIGITNIIPYFGPIVGAVPAALIVLSSGPMNCFIFLVFVLILQQIDGNIIGPKLLAGRVGLSGFWVLFSITFFGGLFGFGGILMGVPVFAIIYDLLGRFVKKGLVRHGKQDILSDPEA